MILFLKNDDFLLKNGWFYDNNRYVPPPSPAVSAAFLLNNEDC